MGLQFAAQITCNHCGASSPVNMEITKLNPAISMHIRLPTGWQVSTKIDSQELLILCPNCPIEINSIPPAPQTFEVEEVATANTIRPPPLPKKSKH